MKTNSWIFAFVSLQCFQLSQAISFNKHKRKKHIKSSLITKTSLAFALSPIPPPPPISIPVWSLSSPMVTTHRNTSTDDDLSSSLDTNEKELSTSMNIITFASPVSVAPPKLWIVSLYNNTLTRESFLSSKIGVLQLLSPKQSVLVPILGKRSGYENNFSKRKACKETNNNEWISFSLHDEDFDIDAMTESKGRSLPLSLDLLPNCACYIVIKLLDVIAAGDHDACLVEVIQTMKWDEKLGQIIRCSDDNTSIIPQDPATALYSAQLRQEGII